MSDLKPDRTEDLGNNPSTKPSNKNNTDGTSSEPKPLKLGVTVGRSPILKNGAVGSIESLRPSSEELKNG